MALLSATFNCSSSFQILPRIEVKAQQKWRINCGTRSQDGSHSRYSGRSNRQVWRRRKLVKKDDMMDYRIERVPFLEERMRRIRETGEIMSKDIERLLLSEDNRYQFVNEVAEEAKRYVENNRDEYGAKKAIHHVLSNRMNDSGIYRPEAYMEGDPFKPGPGYLRQELYDK